MVSFSDFRHQWSESQFACEIPRSKEYRVFLNGREIPVYGCRISKYPFNTWWPGHQRPVDQTDLVSFVNIVSDEEVRLEIEPLTPHAYGRVMVKPYSKNVTPQRVGDRISFTLSENGAYAFEIDDYHSLLYIFNNEPVPCDDRESVTYYFGPGVHFPGKIRLTSGQSVYVDKDAYVYGCIFAENSQNLRIFGNGIFDDSGEERFCEHCYEPYTNGNVKLYDCSDVEIRGVGFTNSAIWCINLFHCFDVSLRGINVFGQWRYNTDGVDIVNCQRIELLDSFIHSFDDTVTVKGIDRYSFEDNADITVRRCVLWCDWGKTCEIGLETSCMEYRNIRFEDCDILRGGNTVCDIQNGDCALVRGITFEDIRIELEGFYTEEKYQRSQDMAYSKQDQLQVSSVLRIKNQRFREAYAFLGIDQGLPYPRREGQEGFASVEDVLVKNIGIYCDGAVLARVPENEIATVSIKNSVPTAEFSNIKVEGVYLNGKRLSREEMSIHTEGSMTEVAFE